MTAEVAIEAVIEVVIEETDVAMPKAWTEVSRRISSSAAEIEVRWAWAEVASARSPTARLYLFQSTQKRPRCRRFSSILISSE
jgi:hypothetical protein